MQDKKDNADKPLAKKLHLTDDSKDPSSAALSSPNTSMTHNTSLSHNTSLTHNTSSANISLAVSSVALSSPEFPVGAADVFWLLRQLGNAYRHRCMFRAGEALAVLDELPQCQRATGWVQTEVGRAWFDAGDYVAAEAAFQSSRHLDPGRLAGLEIYSTVLWFLKREYELCALSQQVTAMDRHAPETWCVLGNCLSLQREYETALKFFQRAVKLDPGFTYAHTLAGHEHVSNEDLDRAMAAFRRAIRCDERHFNAWYGIGTIFLKQEKFDLAEYHFRRAVAINGNNSVLLCYLGMTLLSNRKHEDALAMLDRAVDTDPRNPLVKLKRATTLAMLHRPHEALEELEALKQLAPREATVYFQMGKIYKSLGQPQLALLQFNTVLSPSLPPCLTRLQAMDLDPKQSNLIKATIDQLQMSEDFDADTSL